MEQNSISGSGSASETTALAPAIQLENAAVAFLKVQLASVSVSASDVRGLLDCSGSPVGSEGVYVSAVDNGDHAGTVGRAIIDCEIRINTYTHSDEDQSGARCDRISSAVIDAIASFWPYLTGWNIEFRGGAEVGEMNTMDSAYRRLETKVLFFISKE